MKIMDISIADLSHDVLSLFPYALLSEYCIFPLKIQRNTLFLATVHSLDNDKLDTLSYFARGKSIKTVPTDIQSIEAALCYHFQEAHQEEASDTFEIQEPKSVFSSTPEPPHTNTLIPQIIQNAIDKNASDIHLEPLKSDFRVRYRIDGLLYIERLLSKSIHSAVISNLKLMANMTIDQKHFPQEGRTTWHYKNQSYHLRISIIPCIHGESMSIRILDKGAIDLEFDSLGLSPKDQSFFVNAITQSDGLFLVTGPTGSGKTTSLYSALNYRKKLSEKIITVEDPVECELKGINQTQVRPKIGMTFASALRSILRQSPNVIMIGEIRDLETAQIAINASLTGHLVLSTLHTNDAPSAITRLRDLGIPAFLISTSLHAVMAQHLVRRICKACKQSYTPKPHELTALGLDSKEACSIRFYKGTGCSICSGTGYKGRIGLFECLSLEPKLQKCIYDKASLSALIKAAKVLGFRNIQQDALDKVNSGLISVNEILTLFN